MRGLDEPVVVRVVATQVGMEVIDREAQIAFQPDRTIVLPMNLLESCLTATCSITQTCGEGGCQAIRIPRADPAAASGPSGQTRVTSERAQAAASPASSREAGKPWQ